MKKQLHQVLNKCGFTLQKVDKSTDEQDYRELYSEDSLQNRRFYNIGAGEFAHPFWTNVDNGNDFYTEINGISKHGISHDLFDHKPLPIEDNSAEVVYTSHTMEHIDDASVSFLFRDAYRILKKGGVIRVVVPNIELSYAAWQRGDRKYFFWADWPSINANYEKFSLKIPFGQASLGQMFLDEFATSVCEIVNDGSKKRLSDQELQKIFNEMPFEEAVSYCI
ncbi:MAG TPA: methyltransferase domain-containing protein, partial [Bacteroidia bacterium]|nr:methyltransferase domain-containing protein [Bacteroidia bacterium]